MTSSASIAQEQCQKTQAHKIQSEGPVLQVSIHAVVANLIGITCKYTVPPEDPSPSLGGSKEVQENLKRVLSVDTELISGSCI